MRERSQKEFAAPFLMQDGPKCGSGGPPYSCSRSRTEHARHPFSLPIQVRTLRVLKIVFWPGIGPTIELNSYNKLCQNTTNIRACLSSRRNDGENQTGP